MYIRNPGHMTKISISLILNERLEYEPSENAYTVILSVRTVDLFWCVQCALRKIIIYITGHFGMSPENIQIQRPSDSTLILL